MPLALISSSRFEQHLTPPGHPERVERAHVLRGAAIAWRDRGGLLLDPRPATRDELLAVHTAAHCDAMAATAGRPVALDPDTFTSPDSYDVALLAAGAVCVGVDYTLDGAGPAVALVRPPGHHAEADKAMGFCLFNNAAVGAAYARARGLDRVAVVDIDVHHGNGTQWIFYPDPRVLYVSTHQFPFYPGTGAATETGHGAGEGFTVNVPLSAGATDEDYGLVMRELVDPVLEAYRPDLLIVSAGFDAHEDDPLASMRVTTAGYRRLIDALWQRAAASCGGRCVFVTEGGYDLTALGACLDETIASLSAPAPVPASASPQAGSGDGAEPGLPGPPAHRGRDAVAAVRAAQRRHWPAL